MTGTVRPILAPGDDATRRPTVPWWLAPWAMLPLAVIPVLLVAWRIDADEFMARWRTEKYLDGDGVLVVVTLVLVLVAMAIVGAAVPVRHRHRCPIGGLSGAARSVLERAFWLATGLCLFAYAIWAFVALRNGIRPEEILDAVRANDTYDADLRSRIGTVPGITTLTQAGIATMCLGALLNVEDPSRARRRAMLLVVAIAFVRSFLLSERLAVVELIAPLVVIRATVWASGARRTQRAIAALLPVLAVVVMFVFFAGLEASRSWTYFSRQSQESYLDFASERLVGYYATAFNNSELLRERQLRADVPFYTVQFIWDAPGAGVLRAPVVETERGEDFDELLGRYGSREFNSPGGFTAAIVDFGLGGAFVFTACLGAFIGFLYRAFVAGHLAGRLLYPVVFSGLLDLPRELYLSLGRVTPAYLILGGAAVLAARRSRARLGLRVRGLRQVVH